MKISIVTPTYNEIENIEKLYFKIKEELSKLDCEYEHIIIDNNSKDGTIDKIKDLSTKDKNLKIIINSKNYGHIRSPYHGLLQSTGDASILMASDFQDPVDLIPMYISEWKKGNKIVLGEKSLQKKIKLNFLLENFFIIF